VAAVGEGGDGARFGAVQARLLQNQIHVISVFW